MGYKMRETSSEKRSRTLEGSLVSWVFECSETFLGSFLRVHFFSDFTYSIQCDRTTRSGPALDFAMQCICPKCILPAQLNYEIKLFTEIHVIFNTTLTIDVTADDGTILTLELCKVQDLPCTNCIICK
jgi:hypothetical protein